MHFAICISPSAAAVPLVVPTEGRAFRGEFASIDAEGNVTFRVAAGESASTDGVSENATHALPAAKLVRWSHPAPLKPQTLVLLADGSQLVTAADWSGGAAVRLDGAAIVVRPNALDEARLERAQVAGLVFAHRSHRADRERLADRVRTASGEQDEVLLANGDRLTGSITQLAGGSLTLATAAGDAELPLSRVDAVIFSVARAAGGSPEARLQPRVGGKMIVGLRDGSLFYASVVRADEAKLEIQTAGEACFAGGVRDDVVSLQSLGGDFVYLSDLEPADYRHVPYLDIAWPYERDQSVLGRPLSVGGKRCLKGVGLHSAARLTYRLDGNYGRFQAAIAVDDAAGRRGSIVFAVYLLRGADWQEVFRSDVVRGGDRPRNVSVDLTGARGMALTVDYADRGDELDHADWLDARLVK